MFFIKQFEKVFIPILLAVFFCCNVSGAEGGGPELPDEKILKEEAQKNNSWTDFAEELEKEAEFLERRGELLGAQNSYCQLLIKVIKKTSAEKDLTQKKLLQARADFLLEKAYSLVLQTSRFDFFLSALGPLDRISGKDPVFTGRLVWLKSSVLLKLGRVKDASRLMGSLGMVRNWQIAGSFDNDQGRNFLTALPPQTGPFNHKDKFETLKVDSGWREITTQNHLGFVDLKSYFEPAENCLAYALTAVYSPYKKEAALRIGSDDMLAVFVNSRKVFNFDGFRPPFFDQNIIYFELQKGWNSLLIKSGQAKDNWGFMLRITDKNGLPLKGLRYSTKPATLVTAAKTKPAVKKTVSPPPLNKDNKNLSGKENPYSTLKDSIEVLRHRFKKAKDPHAGYYLGWLLTHRNALSISNKSNMHILLEASRMNPGRAIYYLAFADSSGDNTRHIADRDENARRLMLGKAAAIGPDEVMARVKLAEYYLYDMKNFDKAWKYADEAVKANPLSVKANVIIYDIYKARGWHASAEKLLNKLIKRQPRAVQFLLRRGIEGLKNNNNITAFQAYKKALAADHTLQFAVDGFIESALRLGYIAEIREKAAQLLAINPYNRKLEFKLAEILLRRKKLTEAMQIIKRSLKRCPTDHNMLAVKGEVLKLSGDENGALANWAEAVKLQPTMLTLQKYYKYLAKEDEADFREISDLRAFTSRYSDYPVKAGDNRLYHLYEKISSLNSDGTKSEVVHYVVKILDQDGVKEMTTLALPYEKERENLEILEARVLRRDGRIEAGKPVSGSVRKDVYTYRYLQFSPLSVGDIIEVAYKTSEFRRGFFGDYFGEIYFFKRFFPVITSRYILKRPANKQVYINLTKDEKILQKERYEGNIKITEWEMNNLPAVELEPFMPAKMELSPVVQAGTFRTWEELSDWYWHLIKKQYRMTPEIRRRLKFITAGKETPAEKISAIYNWVTKEVRNVGWEFGVHGYKPYNTGSVFKRRFGDCKDKAALVNVMAEEAGLKAYPVLLRALEERGAFVGRGKEDISLPLFNHFNHCISAVEIDKQIYFLDATSENRPVTSIPMMDVGAEALAVRKEGGKRLQIPAAECRDNSWSEKSMLTISADRKATLRQSITATGNVAAFIRKYFSGNYESNRLLEIFAVKLWGRISVENVSLKKPDDITEDKVFLQTRVKLKALLAGKDNKISFTLPKIWLRGNLAEGVPLPGRMTVFTGESERNYDLVLPAVFEMKSSHTVRIPPGWQLAFSPELINEKTSAGELSFSYSLNGSVLKIDRLICLKKTRIAAADYKDFRKFCQLADQLDNTEFTLEKNK
ncbi:MAG: DUF3857 domain-containing protein [Planctomycetota bacterium]